MDQQRYRAKWINRHGRQVALAFEAPASIGIARIDFALKFHETFEGERMPEKYELEEVEHGGDQGATGTPL